MARSPASRKRVIIISVIAVAVVAVGAMAALSVSAANSRQEPAGRTAAVIRGTLTATVTASGNVTSAVEIDLQLAGSAGTVTKIYVREGQRVSRGQPLLRIDDTAARRQLATAEAGVASAEAQLTTATQGRAAAEQRVDQSGIDSARTSVRNAERGLDQAREIYDLDRRQQNSLVGDAEDDLAEAQEEQQGEDETAVEQARSSLTQARRNRESALLKSRQAVETQQGQVRSAEDQLAAQRAQVAANQQEARKGAVDSAQAQVDSAEVTVREARTAIADTVLRAPRAGTIATIGAVVGQSSSAASAADSGSGGGSGGGGETGAGGSTGTSSSSSAGSSALITLVDLNRKQVEASVAEADVRDVRAGQAVDVRFPATGLTLRGTVLSIATTATVTDNVVEYLATVSLPASATSVRLGQTTSIAVFTARKANALIVPTGAVMVEGGRSYVTRRVDGVDERVEIRTGLVGTTGTEIINGLKAGDQVVLSGTGASPAAPR